MNEQGDTPLWQPSAAAVEAANLTRFIAEVNARHGLSIGDFDGLHAWSIGNVEAFWTALWDIAEIIAETRGNRVLENPDQMPGAKFFPDARLNFAENLLRHRGPGDALVFRGEDRVRSRLSHDALRAAVSRWQQALAGEGVGPGDRIAGFLPNLPETMIAMLATASLGAIWSSCSPDFGVQGVLDRFGQIEPKLLIAADGYWYGGKRFDCGAKTAEIVAQLPGLKRVVMVPYAGGDAAAIANAVALVDWLAPYAPAPPAFAAMPFNAPLYILYSSGTTGQPKCIVHGAGGTLLQHAKEHRLHADVRPGDRLFYFTTCGWMMWNWLASGLAAGATLLLYDGSPFQPDGNALFDFADDEAMTHFGTSAKWLDAVANAGLCPAESHKLEALRVMLSTGSPLAPAGFDFVYQRIKRELHLASISGGTDIVSCFVLGNPIGPVRRGEIQARGLGMDVDAAGPDGAPVRGQPGELVCRNAFPSMPVGFWNDGDGARYRAAYFEAIPGLWCHGDWIEVTSHGGMIIHGRSDATLNPGGVRIGTAEIYRQVEPFDEVLEALVIGQEWDGDTRIVLFVILREGIELDDELVQRIRRRIRENASPRHVPAKLIQVADIPRTVNGKITELAVREVVHGRPVKNREALANPQALELFRDLPELAV